MKQALMLCLLLWAGLTTSFAYSEVSDSTGLPISQAFESPSIVGGFTIKSLFEESESFAPGIWVMHLGSGFKSDVVVDIAGLKKKIPPVSILLEKSIKRNIGFGIRAGFRLWNVPKLEYQYQYYLLSLRGTYHFNLHPKVDPYLGVSALGRVVVNAGNQPEEINRDINYGIFIGCRYYWKTKMGFFAEYGGDGLTHFHGGFFFKL